MGKKNGTIKFDGKPVEIKFDNYTLFGLIKSGITVGDLFLNMSVDDDRFCAAWAAVLGVEFDGDVRGFVNRFSGSDTLFSLNDKVLHALERDGVIPPETDGGDGGGQAKEN